MYYKNIIGVYNQCKIKVSRIFLSILEQINVNNYDKRELFQFFTIFRYFFFLSTKNHTKHLKERSTQRDWGLISVVEKLSAKNTKMIIIVKPSF